MSTTVAWFATGGLLVLFSLRLVATEVGCHWPMPAWIICTPAGVAAFWLLRGQWLLGAVLSVTAMLAILPSINTARREARRP